MWFRVAGVVLREFWSIGFRALRFRLRLRGEECVGDAA